MGKYSGGTVFGLVRKDGATGLLRKKDSRNALNLKVVGYKKNQAYGFVKESKGGLIRNVRKGAKRKRTIFSR